MRMKFSAAGLVLALAMPALLASAPVKAEQLNYDKRGRVTYQGGPNVVVQQGPRTRLYISKRSWLDAGTEVLPGERKYTDYAFPPGPSFATQNNNHPLERQPLNPSSDLGGGPTRFPLY